MITHCGVFATTSNDIKDTIYGLENLQHRGQESCGISFVRNNKIITYRKSGFVKNSFNSINNIKSKLFIGHVRYSTSGHKDDVSLIQPLRIFDNNNIITFAYNGNIPLNNNNFISDSMFVQHFLQKHINNNIVDTLSYFLQTITGVYSMVVLTTNTIYALRDSTGNRPLHIGIKNGVYCIASETCAFGDFKHLRPVYPGELISINNNILKTEFKVIPNVNFCTIELIYFMKPNSYYNTHNVEFIRKYFGEKLADQEEYNINGIVVGSPSSGIIAGKAYADKLKIKYEQLITKNPNYNKRSFIMNNNDDRLKICREKFIFDKDKINNKKIIIVDDSIVRGITMKYIIQLLKEYNAKEIHVRVASPPLKYTCNYGVDIPTKNELIAHNKSIDEIKNILGANTLKYLNISYLKTKDKCTACFNGEYNIKTTDIEDLF